jgi:predicted ATPase
MTDALTHLAMYHEQRGEHEDAREFNQRRVELEPWDEGGQRALMRNLALDGLRSAALKQYQTCRDILAEELGIEPTPETTALYDQIRSGELTTLVPGSVLPSLHQRHNLPAQPTPFIGREAELKKLDELISDPDVRMINILGPGGMGKTRLALAAAKEQHLVATPTDGKVIPRFPEGIYFVAFAGLEDPDAILSMVAKAVGFQFYEGVAPRKQLLDYFRQKSTLLVMDNFEHLKEKAEILAEILEAAPGVRILVTSREKLNLRSETIFRLWGMRFPDKVTSDEKNQVQEVLQYGAVQLFVKSAKRACSSFELQTVDLESVIHICRLVGGMPLGIELAAVLVEMLSPAEIVAEIKTDFDILETEMQDSPERHQSISILFDKTWNVMGENEQEVFKRLSVFRGGFTRASAKFVANASLRQIQTLLSKSLIRWNMEGRYEIHELLRWYAESKLEQMPSAKEEVLKLHCEYYANFLHQREADIDGGDLGQAMRDIDNIRAAWKWAINREKVPKIRKMMHSLTVLNDFQGWYGDAESTFRKAADVFLEEVPRGEQGIVYGRLLAYLGFFTYRSGNQKESLELIRESREVLGQLGAESELAHTNFLFAFLFCPDHSLEAKKHLLKSIEYYANQDDSWEKAYVINGMGHLKLSEANYLESENYYRKGLQISKAIKSQRSIAWSNAGLGVIARERGEYQEARGFLKEAYEIHSSIGYKFIAGLVLNALGAVLMLMGKNEEVKECHLEALSINKDIGKQDGIGSSIYGLGNVAFAMGEYEKATEHYKEALELFKNLEDLTGTTIGFLLCDLGKVAVVMEDDIEAQSKFQEALEIGIHNHNEGLCLTVLGGLSALLVSRGEIELAVEVSSLSANHPLVLAATHPQGGVFIREYSRKQLDEFENLLPLDDFTAAKERGQKLDLQATVEEMLVFLESEQLEDKIGS